MSGNPTHGIQGEEVYLAQVTLAILTPKAGRDDWLLKKVNCDDKEAREIVTNIHEHCETCKRFSPMPARPVVSLPAASKFGAILTLDLKEVQIGP